MTEPAAATLTDSLAAAGFLCLGSFEPEPFDQVPDFPDGLPVRTLHLIGSTGPSLWQAFSNSPESKDGAPHPLDRYSKRVLISIAADRGFEAVFPFEGPPYYPFQQWALKCGGFSQSPLGVLAHHGYGPWTGFRAAFLSLEAEGDIGETPGQGPCETCQDKPCMTACPVNAISLESGYDVPRCREFLDLSRNLDCWSGCLARHACPFGSAHRQDATTARFHMESFVEL